MKFKLTATLTHKSFLSPLTKIVYYEATDYNDLLAQLERQENPVPTMHLHNLKHHRKTAFKDQNGVKHKWLITHEDKLN